MKLSNLQKYILRQGLGSKSRRISKLVLVKFYGGQKNKPKTEDQINIITKSVERLISKKLVKGLGIKTAEKWFVKEVILTPFGIKQAKELLGKQQELPLKNRKLKN
ncbi:MAG TPA: hypothetical protein VJB67_01865 [Patescibacteria group bacterium]|nr:hypothetical protein [Patescibacteria group bacterium]